MNITVELDIFSGGPNPTWTATPEESKKILHLLDTLPEKEKKQTDDGLGYRGFTLTLTPEAANAPSSRIQVSNGIISIESETKRYYQDLHGLEKWLLNQASGQGYGAIIDSL